jgi:cyanoexosortase B-associated protein
MNILNSNSFIARMPKIFQKVNKIQWLILVILTLVFLIGALPGYLSGQWSWTHPPQVRNIKIFRQLEKTGLNVPGWENLAHKSIRIGGKTWIIQSALAPGHDPFAIFLLPQFYYLDLPLIDWLDLNGIEREATDSYQTLKFQTGDFSSNQVTARFFRSWKKDTDAIIQWYAWPGGGNASPSRWFWRDQQAQVRRQRIPWIAVSLKIPIDPLSELKDNEKLALSLAKSVQTTLETQIFKPMNYF